MLLNAFEHFLQGPCYKKEVCIKIQAAIREYEELQTLVKKQT